MAFNRNTSRIEISELDLDSPGNIKIGINAISSILTNFLGSRRGSVPLNRTYGISLAENLFQTYTNPDDIELFVRNELQADIRDYFDSGSVDEVEVVSTNDNSIFVRLQLSIEGEPFTFEETINT